MTPPNRTSSQPPPSDWTLFFGGPFDHRLLSRHRGKVLSSMSLCMTVLVGILTLLFGGCSDDSAVVRQIQSQQQAKLQLETKHDHLGDAHRLLSRLVELNPDESRRQITYHLNRWLDANPMDSPNAGDSDMPSIVKSVSEFLSPEQLAEQVRSPVFLTSDVNHLRDSYLSAQLLQWIDAPQCDDILLTDWLAQQPAIIGESEAIKLRTACRLFDWTVRNIALEAANAPTLFPVNAPSMPLGMTFQGVGYRQTFYQALWRGTGDGLQRANVFAHLCHQADINAAVLAFMSSESGNLTPWAVGVAIGDEVYLFEPELGVFIPGPNQVGIATLSQARSDALVLRRLNIPGLFDYQFSRQDIQQNFALLSTTPIAVSQRMRHLESRLTGNRRMKLSIDHEIVTRELESISGIAGVRIWPVPLLSELYQDALKEATERDPMLAFWYFAEWAMLNAEASTTKNFAVGRWRHLHGQFDSDEEEDIQGARPLYLQQRAPEFEIADLRIDVELQKQYGIRRELGIAPEVYDRQIVQMQEMIRMGKRTATYWLSLIQYDDQQFDTAETWFRKRALDPNQPSRWIPAAQYNLGRTLERLGELDEVDELYKTSGVPQEHGNRIRARLLSRSE